MVVDQVGRNSRGVQGPGVVVVAFEVVVRLLEGVHMVAGVVVPRIRSFCHRIPRDRVASASNLVEMRDHEVGRMGLAPFHRDLDSVDMALGAPCCLFGVTLG